MARKSNRRMAAESALANLDCIRELAAEDPAGFHATFLRNAYDCERWCRALRDGGMDWPEWMVAGNLKYFASIWNLPRDFRGNVL